MPDPMPAMCPTCGHHTSGLVAGKCTAFVPLPEGSERHADYCGCDCYKAVTGRSMFDDIKSAVLAARKARKETP